LPVTEAPVSDVKQMKVKVLEILEKLNEPGIDFFEVWNAAAEMGAVDGNSLKAAFTSLKYVDKSLTKDKLTATGKRYAEELQRTIAADVARKQQQKQSIEQQLVKEKETLATDIQDLERKLNELSQQLEIKQKNLREINSKYEPQLRDIDGKIALGNTAVAEVVKDIQKALDLIESNII
jgi:predicted RNase H-like nuclease (RuvC/YqgF family)